MFDVIATEEQAIHHQSMSLIKILKKSLVVVCVQIRAYLGLLAHLM
jgi:hypothetical protein